MSRYVDGFLLPVSLDRVADYRKVAQLAGEIWREHGALDYWECVGEELDIDGMISFRKLADAQDGETVVFAWIVYESKAARDAILPKVMEDPRLKASMDPNDPIIDFERMAYGVFREIVHA